MVERSRILYVQPNSEVGGSDIALLRLVACLDRTRFDPVIVLPGDGPLVQHFKALDAAVHFVPMRQLRTLVSLSYQTSYLTRFWPTVRAVARLIESENIRFVHTNSLYCLYGAWAARQVRRPHLWHVREIPPAIPLAKPLYAAMVRRLSKAVIGMTRNCLTSLFGSAVDAHGFYVVADGLDLARFDEQMARPSVRGELGIPPDIPLIGFVARLDPWKGLHVFLDAARLVSEEFPQAQFLVAGSAPPGYENYETSMRERARSLRLERRVHFLGWRYRLDDIPRLMRSLDVFSHTAVQPEPFGLVLLEAMAASRPVVASKAGGPLEIIREGETGMLAEPGSVRAHADCLCRLLRDPARRESMGREGRLRVESQFSAATFARRLHAIYADIESVKGASGSTAAAD